MIFNRCVVNGRYRSVSVIETPADRLKRNVRKSGSWSSNHIFGRCKSCHGLTIRGICQFCGFTVVCCFCHRVKWADGKYRKSPHDAVYDSHTVCPECSEREYPDIRERRKQKREKERNLEIWNSLNKGLKDQKGAYNATIKRSISEKY